MIARPVAVVGTALQVVPAESTRNEVEMVMPALDEAFAEAGLTRKDIGFTCSGSSDYLMGQPFAFVAALDAVGAWPPIRESHVEMDGAWALHEAWVRLQHGDLDTALVYSFGISSRGDLPRLLALQLDPYLVGPLWPDTISLAGLQARLLLESGRFTERDIATVSARSRQAAGGGDGAELAAEVDKLLASPRTFDPLRASDCPPVDDGVAVVILAAGDRANEIAEASGRPPAWLRGIDHRIEPQALGLRDLTRSESTRLAATGAGVADGPVDLAELHAPFAHQELILREALGLPSETPVNLSGGALASNPMMAAGLARIVHAARAVSAGRAGRAVAHATSGPCLQQNLVAVLGKDA